jgi:hypothetical protein
VFVVLVLLLVFGAYVALLGVSVALVVVVLVVLDDC